MITRFVIMCCHLVFRFNDMEVPSISFLLLGVENMGEPWILVVRVVLAGYSFIGLVYICGCSLALHDYDYTLYNGIIGYLNSLITFIFHITYGMGVPRYIYVLY